MVGSHCLGRLVPVAAGMKNRLYAVFCKKKADALVFFLGVMCVHCYFSNFFMKNLKFICCKFKYNIIICINLVIIFIYFQFIHINKCIIEFFSIKKLFL